MSAMPPLSKTEIVECVLRACRHSARSVHQGMTRGLSTLATIASTAPLIGLFGTVLGIYNSFRGVAGDARADMAAEFGWLAEALLPTAWSLLLALVALCCYRYLCSQIEAFDLEMENATTELVNYVSLQLHTPN